MSASCFCFIKFDFLTTIPMTKIHNYGSIPLKHKGQKYLMIWKQEIALRSSQEHERTKRTHSIIYGLLRLTPFPWSVAFEAPYFQQHVYCCMGSWSFPSGNPLERTLDLLWVSPSFLSFLQASPLPMVQPFLIQGISCNSPHFRIQSLSPSNLFVCNIILHYVAL